LPKSFQKDFGKINRDEVEASQSIQYIIQFFAKDNRNTHPFYPISLPSFGQKGSLKTLN
jgi:hypothetical protein